MAHVVSHGRRVGARVSATLGVISGFRYRRHGFCDTRDWLEALPGRRGRGGSIRLLHWPAHLSFAFSLLWWSSADAVRLSSPERSLGMQVHRGLLRRAHITAGELRYIGKETNRKWEEGDDISVLEFKTTEYGRSRRVVASEEVKGDIKRIGIKKCARESRFDRWFIRNLLRGVLVKRNSYSEFVRWLQSYKSQMEDEPRTKGALLAAHLLYTTKRSGNTSRFLFFLLGWVQLLRSLLDLFRLPLRPARPLRCRDLTPRRRRHRALPYAGLSYPEAQPIPTDELTDYGNRFINTPDLHCCPTAFLPQYGQRFGEIRSPRKNFAPNAPMA